MSKFTWNKRTYLVIENELPCIVCLMGCGNLVYFCFKYSQWKPISRLPHRIRRQIQIVVKVANTLSDTALLAFLVVCLVIINEWPPLSDRLLWFW